MISKEYKRIVADKGKSQWLNRESNVKRFISFLKKRFGKVEGLRVLDAGCAQGRDSQEISKYGIIVKGIDYDKNFIEEAKKNNPLIEFDYGKIEELPYENNIFDAVYCVNTLFYTNPEKSFPELERVLKNEGILFITLDEKIINLDENKIIHELDIENSLKIFKLCRLLSKEYKERLDEVPFKHKHFFYEIALQKSRVN